MEIKRSKWALLSTLMMITILILAMLSTNSSIMIAAISQADTNTWIAFPIDDAGITRGFPDNKRGVEEPWQMWTSSCSGVPYSGYFLSERSFLKFDLSAIPSLGNSNIRLYVYCYKTDAAPNGDVQCCYVNDDNWSENTLTWNTQPELGGVLDTRTITEADKWYSWDVTSFIENEFAGDKIASFCLKTPMEYNEYPNNYFYGWRTKEFWEDWARPYLIIGRNVGVLISPNYQEGLAGGALNYEVNVTNKGSLPDNYDLTVTVGDNVGWILTLSESSLEGVQPGEKRTVTLSAIVPENAELCAEDSISVTVASITDSGISDSDMCVAHVSKRVMPPRDDLAVVTGDPTVGNWSGFWVGRYHNNPERGWLKFDLQAIPANFEIRSVRLYLYCWEVEGGANVQVHRADNDEWRENETNCWSEPSFGAAISDPQLVNSVGWYSWDVTSYTKSEFMGDKIVGFCLVDLGENTSPDHAASFESKEWSNKDLWPYLEVEGDLISLIEPPSTRWPLITGIFGTLAVISIAFVFYLKRRQIKNGLKGRLLEKEI